MATILIPHITLFQSCDMTYPTLALFRCFVRHDRGIRFGYIRVSLQSAFFPQKVGSTDHDADIKVIFSPRIIIQSQPQCNNMLIFGCALCLLSLIFMGLPVDGGLAFPAESFVFLCHVSSIVIYNFSKCAFWQLFYTFYGHIDAMLIKNTFM